MDDKNKISIPLYILVMFFNISSWIDLDALWAELPLFVQRLPEYWALPSYIILIVDITAIFPILYNLGNKYKPNIFREVPTIYVVIGTGFVGSILMIFLWHKTAIIGGEPHSIALFCLVFLLSTVDSTSTVAFLAYLSRLPEGYISAYFVGEGLCGFVPSVFALLQGAGEYDCVNTSFRMITNYSNLPAYNKSIVRYHVDGENANVYSSYTYNLTSWEVKQVLREPTFSVEAFLSIISCILAISGISFTLINFHPWCKKHHVVRQDSNDHKAENGEDRSAKEIFLKKEHEMYNGTEKRRLGNGNVDNRDVKIEEDLNRETRLPTNEYLLLVSQLGWQMGMQYGVLYSLQSYSLLPYGNLAFSLGNRLNRVVLPISSFAALHVPVRSTKIISIITALGTVPAFYIIFLAAMSPDPPLKGTDAGMAIAVAAWLLMTILWGYVKVGIGVKLRNSCREHLMSAGSVCMVTLFVLNIVVFILINVFDLFKSSPPC